MSIKILATADIHLGRISSESDSIGDHGTTRFTWYRLVEWAIDQSVDAVAIAGDIVEHDNRYFEAAGALERGLADLNKAGISVYMIAGNHDYDVLPALMKEKNWENVHLLGKDDKWEVHMASFNGIDIQFVGWSFPERYYRQDPFRKLSVNQINPGLPSIGLFHGDYEMGESQYAPTQFSSLSGKAVDAWIMGHIHKPQVFQDSGPLIMYTGSPHALSMREQETHGPVLITVESSNRIEYEHIAMSPVQFEVAEVDITECDTKDDIRREMILTSETEATLRIQDPSKIRLVVFDIVLTGIHKNVSEIDDWLIDWDSEQYRGKKDGYEIAFRKIHNRSKTKIEDLPALAKQPSPAGLLAQAIIDLETGRESEFINTLKKQMSGTIADMNLSKVFLPIRNEDEGTQIDPAKDVQQIDEMLLTECHRLLSELLATKEEATI